MNDYEKLFTKTRKQKHQLRILINKTTYYKQEIERLNNIINELEKYLIEYSQDLEFRCYCNAFLDKLRELKGDSSNE